MTSRYQWMNRTKPHFIEYYTDRGEGLFWIGTFNIRDVPSLVHDVYCIFTEEGAPSQISIVYDKSGNAQIYYGIEHIDRMVARATDELFMMLHRRAVEKWDERQAELDKSNQTNP